MPMKRAARAALLLSLAALAACTERPAPEAYLDVLPRAVEFAEADARRTQPGQPAQGPLIVDLASFAYGARTVTATQVDTARLRAAVGRPFMNIPFTQADSAMLCDEGGGSGLGGGTGGCWVRQYGVYLHLNQARAAGDRMTLLVTSTSTNRSVFPTHICDRVWRLVFLRSDGEWELAERDLRRTTCETVEEVPLAAGA